jgi:hypothetical protein
MCRPIALALAATALAAACDDDPGAVDAVAPDAAPLADGAPVDVGAPIDAGCDLLWDVVISGATAGATVGEGALVLTSTNTAQGTALVVLQTGLTGDFSASFAYDSFVYPAATAGGFVQAVVAEDVAQPAAFASAGVGSFPVIGVSAGLQGGVADMDVQAGDVGGGGVFHLERTGDALTATSTQGATTATRTVTYAADPLRIGLQLGSNHGEVAGTVSIRVLSFTITGGGGPRSDGFDCDSLRP